MRRRARGRSTSPPTAAHQDYAAVSLRPEIVLATSIGGRAHRRPVVLASHDGPEAPADALGHATLLPPGRGAGDTERGATEARTRSRRRPPRVSASRQMAAYPPKAAMDDVLTGAWRCVRLMEKRGLR